MGYTRLSIRKNNKVRKYILFYADYLNEAWLSEVIENDTTRIIKQFKYKNRDDLNNLVGYISAKGEVINLSSDEPKEKCLQILENRLLRKSGNLSLVFKLMAAGLWSRISGSAIKLGIAS